MKCLWYILVVFVLLVSFLPKWSTEVELNMQGTVNLGKDVVEVLSQYIAHKKHNANESVTKEANNSEDENLNGRRSNVGPEGTTAKDDKLGDRRSYVHREASNAEGDKHGGKRSYERPEGSDAEDEDTIPKIVSSAELCRELEFCKGDLGVLVNKYITMLTEGVESIFKGLVNDINKNNDENSEKVLIFEEELKGMIKDIKNLIRNANADVRDNDVAYTWVNFIKKISAKFLDRAISFASQRLEGNADEILEVKKILAQKIVIVIAIIELKFENALCSQHDICAKSYECTKALNSVLDSLETVSEENLKAFVKYFYETLSSTNFYNRLSDITAHEFQLILRDIADDDSILAKNILLAIHKSVEERQKHIVTKFKTDDSKLGRDVKLLHIILSDMDFFYSKQKDEPFHDFFGDFYDWLKEGGRLGSPLHRLMKDIQNKLSFAANDLVIKLIDEVKVFMEITVDPVP